MEAKEIYNKIYQLYRELRDNTESFCMYDFEDSLAKVIIENSISESNGIKGRAAKLMGLGRTALVMRCKKYGVPLNPYDPPYVPLDKRGV